MDAEYFRAKAREYDLLAFSDNNGWLAKAAKDLEDAADVIESLSSKEEA